MTRKEYAEFLVPNVLHDKDYYEAKYPERNLDENALVVRIGPSPTGFVHFGTLFQAMAGHNLAKNSNGIFYVRIEDTDQKREVENGTNQIIDALNYYNISYDEGPTIDGEEKGNYGPYIQSKRGDIYKSYIRDLIEKDLAYPSFATEKDLEELRSQQEASKSRLGYYGRFATDRNLSMETVIEKVKNGEKYVIRFKSPGVFENKMIIEDLVKGKIEMPENDIDHVILKGDGLPTYHFAHVIDDHLMHTTHVVRGDEWLSSLPVHLQMFEVLGFKAPKYGHPSPIMKEEEGKKRKLSKRKDKEANIDEYKKMGIPEEAIKEYLLTLINSNFEEWRDKNPEKELDDFNVKFKKMNISGSLFDMEKLLNISKNFLSKITAEDFYQRLITWASKYDEEFFKLLEKYPKETTAILNIERGGEKPRKDYDKYQNVYQNIWYMYDEKFNSEKSEYEFDKITDIEEITKILTTYLTKYYDEKDAQDVWFSKIKVMADELGYASNMKEYKQNPDNFKGNIADISTVIRVAVTSKKQTPNLYDILKILGTDKIEERFQKVINHK